MGSFVLLRPFHIASALSKVSLTMCEFFALLRVYIWHAYVRTYVWVMPQVVRHMYFVFARFTTIFFFFRFFFCPSSVASSTLCGVNNNSRFSQVNQCVVVASLFCVLAVYRKKENRKAISLSAR